ncbi:MAG: HlyC/CorC family transporter [Candidatus Woesearchaeota archaeon]|nr:MAG: HlyC/CorC family transporter [Candidatus Woesearchaeota archaeon]
MILLIIGLVLIIVLILLSAFFSGAEMAFVSVNRALIRKKARRGNKNAKIIDKLFEKPKRVVNSIVVGNNVVNILASIIAGAIATEYFGNIGIGIATAIMTFMVVIFAEVTPKALGIKNERFLLKIAKPLYILTTIVYPFAIFLVHISNSLLSVIGKKNQVSEVTEEEIKAIVELGAEEGALEKDEMELVSEALDFDDTHALEIHVPRKNIISLRESDTINNLIRTSIKTGFSRFPIYRGNIDNITGMVHVKDTLNVENKRAPLFKIKRDILKIKSGTRADDILQKMRKAKKHLAVIQSDTGKTLGIITMEDLIEELFGEIIDEHDISKKIK